MLDFQFAGHLAERIGAFRAAGAFVGAGSRRTDLSGGRNPKRPILATRMKRTELSAVR